MKLNLDMRQAKALKMLIQIAQSDDSLDSSLKYEVSTILPELDVSPSVPIRSEFRSVTTPFILGPSATRLLTPVEPAVIKKIFQTRGNL